MFDTLMVFLKEFFKKDDFEKNQQVAKRMKNGPSSKRLCRMRGIIGASLRLEHVIVAFHCLAITQHSF